MLVKNNRRKLALELTVKYYECAQTAGERNPMRSS